MYPRCASVVNQTRGSAAVDVELGVDCLELLSIIPQVDHGATARWKSLLRDVQASQYAMHETQLVHLIIVALPEEVQIIVGEVLVHQLHHIDLLAVGGGVPQLLA